ncbi:DUF4177 domain-containing protein [Marivita sp.]|uniref:DUF4177 domain-containing protein n=1 Tax=Marivita sp. TaxID=2003365 RepID=UPI0025B8E565|nr:DUF4177 domain-containing protein [Marivita sp.]
MRRSKVFEYKVIPAPEKGVKAKGVKAPEARFALGVEKAINRLAADGWEYLRSDVLPSQERQGLTGSVTHWRTLLVFRRAIADDTQDDVSQVLTGPIPPVMASPPAPKPPAVPPVAPVVVSRAPEAPGPEPAHGDTADIGGTADTPAAEADTTAREIEFEEGSEETRPA